MCDYFFIFFSYKVNGEEVRDGKKIVVRFDASDNTVRGFELSAGSKGMKAMLFAGKRINEPIAWRGPIVMNTQVK